MTKIREIILIDEHHTKKLGQELGKCLNNTPLLIFLRGEVGVGKTTLTQGFIEARLRRKCFVQSPTYAYMHTYEHSLPIFHFDLYRINDPEEITELGLADFIEDPGALRLIEWPERLGPKPISFDLEINLVKTASCHKALINYSFLDENLINLKALLDISFPQCYQKLERGVEQLGSSSGS